MSKFIELGGTLYLIIILIIPISFHLTFLYFHSNWNIPYSIGQVWRERNGMWSIFFHVLIFLMRKINAKFFLTLCDDQIHGIGLSWDCRSSLGHLYSTMVTLLTHLTGGRSRGGVQGVHAPLWHGLWLSKINSILQKKKVKGESTFLWCTVLRKVLELSLPE